MTAEEVSAARGTPTVPGTPSPGRDRSVEENLDLFARMKNGEFPDGAKTLRAKIDMASPNFNMRDPVVYRIIDAEHHRTGNTWKIYPIYDWAHGLEDSIEGITHSLCTLEFENHRPLYDWFLDQLGIYHPSRSIRPPQPDIHRHEQAQASRAGQRLACFRMGRPADADDLRFASPGLYTGLDPQLLQGDRRGQVQQYHRRYRPQNAVRET